MLTHAHRRDDSHSFVEHSFLDGEQLLRQSIWRQREDFDVSAEIDQVGTCHQSGTNEPFEYQAG
jgi:hypothetical protein